MCFVAAAFDFKVKVEKLGSGSELKYCLQSQSTSELSVNK